ncbi:MAG: DUF898 family protein, partial [Inhella sp.]
MSDTPLPAAESASLPPIDPDLASAAPPPAFEPVSRPLLLQFTASGSEYFRIWIVNLLLIVLTLG